MSKVRGAISLPLVLLVVAALALVGWLVLGGGPFGSGVSGEGGSSTTDEVDLLAGRGLGGAEATGAGPQATLTGAYDSDELGGIRARLLWLANGRPVTDQPVRLIGVRGVLVADLATDADGTVLFRDVAPGTRYTLHIRGEGFAELLVRNIEVLPGRITQVPEFRLGDRIVLSGRVVDASGRPVAGSRVSVHEVRTDLFQRGMIFAMVDMATSEDPALADTRTDEQGRFNFGTLDTGRYRLQARASGYATDYEQDVLVRSDRDATVLTLVLGRGADARGTVKDDQGRPVAGAVVRALRDEGRRFNAGGSVQREEAVTDAQGRYVIDTLTPGTDYRFGVIATGYPTMWEVQGVTAEAGLVHDFVLPRGARIEGVVREKGTGTPIAGAEIVVMAGQMGRGGGRGGRGGGGDAEGGAPATMGTQTARSGEDGTYVLDPVQGGPVMTLSVKAEGYTGAAASMFTGNALPDLVPGETLVHEVELERGGRIVGRITEAEGGKPIVGAAVEVTGNMMMMWTGAPATTTDQDGRYELVGLMPGDYRVTVRADGFAEAESAETITISEQGNQAELDMQLAGAGRLVGIVLDMQGDPVAGAKVFARGQSPDAGDGGPQRGGQRMMQRLREQLNPRIAVTDEDGRFELPGLAPRLVWVAAVVAEGFVETESERVRLAEGDTREVEIVLHPGAVIEGRVVDEDNRWVAGARVRYGTLDPELARRRNLTSWEVQGALEPEVVSTADDGSFRVTDLKAGIQVVQVEADGYVTLIKRDVRVAGGEVRGNYLLTVRRGETVRGIVLDPDGRPVPGAAVGMSQGGRPAMGGNNDDLAPEGESGGDDVAPALFDRTGTDGRFTIENVPPGSYSVYVWFAPGFQGVTTGSEAAARDNQTIPGANDFEFRLERQAAGAGGFPGRPGGGRNGGR